VHEVKRVCARESCQEQDFIRHNGITLALGVWRECVWLVAGLSSLTWPESDRLDSGAGWGCTPVVH